MLPENLNNIYSVYPGERESLFVLELVEAPALPSAVLLGSVCRTYGDLKAGIEKVSGHRPACLSSGFS